MCGPAQWVCRHETDLSRHRSGPYETRTVITDAFAEVLRSTDRAPIQDGDDNLPVFFHQRHDAVDELVSVGHLAFAEFQQANVKVSEQRLVTLGRALQKRRTAYAVNAL